jgi:hypothetical protein
VSYEPLGQRWVSKLFLKGSQIHKFLGSFRYCKYANFLVAPVNQSQVRVFINLSQNSPKTRLVKDFFILCKFELKFYHLCIFVGEKVPVCICGLAEVLSQKITIKVWVCETQIRNVYLHLRPSLFILSYSISYLAELSTSGAYFLRPAVSPR